MRFMYMVKMDETPREVPQSLFEAMAAYDEEGRRTGVLLLSEGLLPSAAGALISAVDGKVKAVDGLFAEAEDSSGAMPWSTSARRRAVELGRRLVQLHLDHVPDGTARSRSARSRTSDARATAAGAW